MLVSDFDFHLPPELIAQHPPDDRAGARMMHLHRESGQFHDSRFRDLPKLLRPTDLLVFNNTRVFPARLFGRRAGLNAAAEPPKPGKNPDPPEKLRGILPKMLPGMLTGRVEALLTRQLAEQLPETDWLALVHPGQKIHVGERLFFSATDPSGTPVGAPELKAEVIARGTFGERTLRFQPIGAGRGDFFAIVDRIGHIPLPPYINRPDSPADRDRYQTVFAHTDERGSVAAPTAGLHFTPEILDAIRQRGIETVELTLHVGLGTFQPLRNEVVEENKLHREAYSISEAAASTINRAKQDKRRIVAVGTTTARTLEFAAASAASQTQETSDGAISPGRGDADIFIYPGFRFQIVDALLTNFHLPRSSLLMLVSAFAGRENILRAYQHAISEHYRFFSYGDCMFID